MTERILDKNNFANDKLHTLYKKWNEGKCGLLLTGNIQVDRRNVEATGNVIIEENSYKDQFNALLQINRFKKISVNNYHKNKT